MLKIVLFHKLIMKKEDLMRGNIQLAMIIIELNKYSRYPNSINKI